MHGGKAVIVTGGHGSTAVDHLFDGRRHVEIPVPRHLVAARTARMHAFGDAGRPSRQGWALEDAAGRRRPPRQLPSRMAGRDRGRGGSRGRPRCAQPRACATGPGHRRRGMTSEADAHVATWAWRPAFVAADPPIEAAGASDHQLRGDERDRQRHPRDRRRPAMAHAPEEVAEMATVAGALVLNIGTLTREWVDSMILAGRAANVAGVPWCSTPSASGRPCCAPIALD